MKSELQVHYRAGGGLAKSTITLLILSIPMSMIIIGSELWYHTLVQRAFAGEMISEDEAIITQGLCVMVAIGAMLLFIATGVVFLCWKYRAHKNLKALGAQELQYSPGWAVGYYFIPFLNLVRPTHVMSEIWRASGPEIKSGGPTAWKSIKPTFLITGWWAAWICAGLLNRISKGLANSDFSDMMAYSTYMGITSSVISIIGALYLIDLIREITRRQDYLAEGLIPVEPSPLGFFPQQMSNVPEAVGTYPTFAHEERFPPTPQPTPEYFQDGMAAPPAMAVGLASMES